MSEEGKPDCCNTKTGNGVKGRTYKSDEVLTVAIFQMRYGVTSGTEEHRLLGLYVTEVCGTAGGICKNKVDVSVVRCMEHFPASTTSRNTTVIGVLNDRAAIRGVRGTVLAPSYSRYEDTTLTVNRPDSGVSVLENRLATLAGKATVCSTWCGPTRLIDETNRLFACVAVDDASLATKPFTYTGHIVVDKHGNRIEAKGCVTT